MPELPEVETTVLDLKRKVLKRTFLDLWTDFPKVVKKPKEFRIFKKEILGKEIKTIFRRGKNILFELSDNKILLIHQKMTGHILLGDWRLENKKWQPLKKGALEESVNKFIHLMFWLSGGLMLALSDLRKFAKVELWDVKELSVLGKIKALGPEPLGRAFTFNKFKRVITRSRGKIKKVLMDQNVIVGIGNIYSDEILWEARIHPFRGVSLLSEKEHKNIYKAMKKVLLKAISLKGDSVSDYRLINGEKGGYQEIQKVYRQEGEKCPRNDGGIIQRLKMGGRSAHFCPRCQKI